MNAFKRYTKTLLCAAGLLAAALVSGCGGGGDQGRDPILGLPAASLVSVAVTPATASVAIGATQKFAATATYSDGSSRDVTTLSAWTSATPAVASVGAATGLAVGVNPGTSVIAAAFNGKSGSGTLTVLPANLVSIAIAPVNPSINIGATQQFMALGTFDNNTTRDITAVSTFSSATTSVATIGASSALAVGKVAGTSVITATSGGISGSTTLTVKPAVLTTYTLAPQGPTLRIGASQQLAATAGYSDGTMVDVTIASTYVSQNPAAVSTTPTTGLITGVAAGSSVITASYKGMNATTTATTLGATLSSISVLPASAIVGIGGTQQYIAIGTYSDLSTAVITNSVNWTSGNTAVATVLNTGVATGVAAGNTTIIATLGANSGNAAIVVVAAPPPPPPASFDLGRASSFAVLAGTALTNNSGGTTVVTGDVGSPSQTVDPVVVGGTNYKSGSQLTNALADLNVAIDNANGRTCDITFPGDIDLGGLVLTPGVYCTAGTISITGTLELSGNGLFIFRTALTLNSTANSVVKLSNGATSDNVIWVPVGATTLGANSVFKGSILAKTSAITIGDNTTLLNGRALSEAAVTLKNNQITK